MINVKTKIQKYPLKSSEGIKFFLILENTQMASK